MQVSLPGSRVCVTVDLHQHGRTVFRAALFGRRRPADRSNVVRMMLRRPLGTYRVSALIRRHGIALWLRRIRIHPRPQHAHE